MIKSILLFQTSLNSLHSESEIYLCPSFEIFDQISDHCESLFSIHSPYIYVHNAMVTLNYHNLSPADHSGFYFYMTY